MNNNLGEAAGFGMGGFLLGMLAGAVVAGVTVLLLAPRPGYETRSIIRGKAVEAEEMMQNRLKEVKEKAVNITRNLRSKAENEMQSSESERLPG